MEYPQRTGHPVSARLHHQAVHRGEHPTARGARQAQGRRSHLEIHAGSPCRVEEHHLRPSAQPHLRHSELYFVSRLRAATESSGHLGAACCALSRSTSNRREMAGMYQLAPEFLTTITLQGDHLVAQATYQPTAPIFASSPTR